MNGSKYLLQGRKALVTGAGKGIGRSVSLALAANGADICAVSRTETDIEHLADEIRKQFPVNAYHIVADVSSKHGANGVIKKAIALLGRIDIVVCAAGFPLVQDLWDRKIHESEEDDFLKVFHVDVLGSLRIIKDALPEMMKQRSGVIILFSSTPAITGYNRGAPYTVSKAANLGLVKEIAAEYGSYNIRAYAIAPGNIKTTRTFEQLTKEEQQKLADEAPMKRWGNPEEVAEVAVALASDKMSFVTGQTIVVDGGTVML